MAQCYFDHKRCGRATFDLLVRELPACRRYLVACGLKDIIAYLLSLRFSRDDIGYLRKQRLFSEEFLSYLSSLRFSGDMWAMPEGTVCFAQEPLIRVTAPVIEAQIIESFLLNTVNVQTMIASKAARIVSCAGKSGVYDFSLRRTHGSEAGLKAAYAAYLAGCKGTSNVLAGKLYGIPVAGTMAHSFVMSFGNELESFSAYSSTFPEQTVLLVDTYDTKKGIHNAVIVGKRLAAQGNKLKGIRLDSGDIASLSRYARAALDKAGLDFVRIFASGNLDEYKIQALVKAGAPVDNFGVGTHMGTSADAPSLDVVYKISEVTDEKGDFLPTMKLSAAKVTYPGRKQVFRIKGKNGLFVKDVLGLENERIPGGEPLLKKMVSCGKAVLKPKGIEAARRLLQEQLKRFPGALTSIKGDFEYPVKVSPQLEALKRRLTKTLTQRQ